APDGQRAMLGTYDVTEATIGAPFETSMDVDELGETASGVRAVVSSVVRAADAVILINRVKPHTDFDGAFASGLIKMSAIGLGKAEGAIRCHWAAATRGHEPVIREVSEVVLARLPRPYGIALIADGAHRLARIETLRADEFH